VLDRRNWRWSLKCGTEAGTRVSLDLPERE
jgi:hypothetical protein